jgi:hypothetical protein
VRSVTAFESRLRTKKCGNSSSVSQRSQNRYVRFSVVRALTLSFSRASSALDDEPLAVGEPLEVADAERHIRQAFGFAAAERDEIGLCGLVRVATRDEGDLRPVGTPGRAAVGGRVGRQPLRRPAGDGHDIDVRVSTVLVHVVFRDREGDERAVGRHDRRADSLDGPHRVDGEGGLLLTRGRGHGQPQAQHDEYGSHDR